MKDFRNVPGHLYEAEGIYLQEIAADKVVLEIGTHHGKSTAALASTAKHVTTLDNYLGDSMIGAPNKSDTISNLRGYHNIALLETDWKTWSLQPDRYDLIFYDGDHTQEKEFLSNLTKYPGDIILHDYKPNEPAFSHIVEAVRWFADLTGRSFILPTGSLAHFEKQS